MRISNSPKGSALVMSLLMLVLITVLVLAVTVQAQLERQLSAAHFAKQQARTFAQLGLDTAVARIRQTLSPFDDPFGSTPRPSNFWSLSPGRIDLFALTNGNPRPLRLPHVELHSGYPVANTNAAANLNAPDSYGRRPIWSENRKMEVDWVPVGRNPAEALSNTNPLAGRFAFWVDDEGSKINVNTADGSDNYSLRGYGQGTPAAVNLSVFHDLGDPNAPDRETVRLIAAEARRQPFSTIAEIATREALTNALSRQFPATNAFNLATYSRSPDFNIFNLPRFQLIPGNGTNISQLAGANGFAPVNIMIQYPPPGALALYYPSNDRVAVLRSVYPGYNQLNSAWKAVYPAMPAAVAASAGIQKYHLITSNEKRTNAGGTFPITQEARFWALRQMEEYLAGTNALGEAIRWPFRDENYLQKYNLRQLDSIALQIFDLAQNAGDLLEWQAVVSPSIAPYGILGDKPVQSAMGRYPRMTRILAKFDLAERAPVLWKTGPGPKDYYDANADGKIDDEDKLDDGSNFYGYIAFSLYLPRHLYDSDSRVDGQVIDNFAWYWTTAKIFGWDTGLNETDWVYGTKPHRGSMLNPASQWMDTLMYAEASEDGVNFEPGNSSGIDFFGNPPSAPDPDDRAPIFRRSTWTNNAPLVLGTGPHPTAIRQLLLYDVFGSNPNAPNVAPGLSQNFFNNASGGTKITQYKYPTRNRGGVIRKIRLRGGLTLRAKSSDNGLGVTPIDHLAGPLTGGTNNPMAVIRTGPLPTNNVVIPLFGKEGMELATNQTKYLVAKVRDPLVNQLPGDWLVKTYSALPGAEATPNARIFNIAPDNTYGNSLATNSTVWDYLPEPEWVDMAADSGSVRVYGNGPGQQILRPYWDGGAEKVEVIPDAGLGGATRQILNIARQKAFPSVGHLQYVRTGAMPDNENAQIGDADYAGMPFRCLNFGPAGTQGGIPDWAMLDLFTVPNAIYTRPSSRMAYPKNSPADPSVLIHLTYGGASTGKINLNGSVVWPWAEEDPAYVRPMPLAAQFNGLRYNQDGKVYRTNKQFDTVTSTNSWRQLSAPEACGLAEAIAAYVRANGPLAMSGQICDIPAVNAFGAQIPTTNPNGESLLPPNTGFYGRGLPSPDGINRTRNDIVSQSIGNLVTQGNVFAVWVVGQSIQKSLFSDPDTFQAEKGDRVMAQTRLRFLVERKLDPGVDGVYGNARPKVGTANPGPAGWDAVIGTPDDLMDPDYHPSSPKFIYQVINVREIQ